jgi:predicted kinase
MTASFVVVSGLPGVGKTTVATRLARRPQTPYVRVDLVEQTIVDWSSLSHPLGPVGYAVAYQLAGQQLTLGLDVVVECVNPIAELATRGLALLRRPAGRCVTSSWSAPTRTNTGVESTAGPPTSLD